MQYGLEVITPPAVEPVTLTEVKAHLGMSPQFVRDDVYLNDQLIPQCRREVEDYTNRALITQSLALSLDYQPPAIYLPRNPIQSITQVDYLDGDGNSQVFDSANYKLINDREPGILELVSTASWPTRLSGERATMIVTYAAGYGNAGTDVPEDIRAIILRMIESYYRFRGQGELPMALYFAMDNWRVGDEFTQYDIGTARGIVG